MEEERGVRTSQIVRPPAGMRQVRAAVMICIAYKGASLQ